MIDSAQHELLAKVASMYYEREMTQNEIAAALELSRVKIYRLLKQARETQVVRILIDWHIKRAPAIEAQLVEGFGLDEALVLGVAARPIPPCCCAKSRSWPRAISRSMLVDRCQLCPSVSAVLPTRSSTPSGWTFRRMSKSCKPPAASPTRSRNSTVPL